MDMKIVFLLVVGCALVYARPDPDPEASLDDAKEKVIQWWNGAKETVSETYDKAKETAKETYGKVAKKYEQIVNRLTGKQAREAQEALEKLKAELADLEQRSDEAKREKQAKWEKIIKERESDIANLKKEVSADIERENQVWANRFEVVQNKIQQINEQLND